MPNRERHPVLHLAGALVAGLMVLPLLYLVARGVELADTPALGVLFRADTAVALARSLGLAAGVAALCVGLSLPLAWLTHATDLPARRVFRVLLVLPLAVPSYLAGFVVVTTFGPRGALQSLLAPLGVERLADIDGAPGATLSLLYAYPFALLPIQAALARVDPRVWEAGRTLGASPLRVFREVVLPELRPAIAGGGLLVGLYVLSDFGAVSLLRFPSLSYLVYLRYRSLHGRGEAVYLAALLAVAAIALLLAQRKVHGRDRAVSVRGSVRGFPVVRLGRYRPLALAYCALVSAFGVGLPLAVIVGWLVRGVTSGGIGRIGLETASTVGVGVAGAVLVVLAAGPPALLMRFGSRRFARLVAGAAHTGFALPGIVVALSLVFLAARFAGPLYQTLPLLLFAYVVRFLPLAFGSLSESLERQDPRLYEAARTLGCTPLSAWRRVVLPAAVPALWAGLLAAFLSIVKELPTTLLLSPIGFRTLATRVWSLTEDAYFAAAAPAALALLALATVALVLRPDVDLRGTP